METFLCNIFPELLIWASVLLAQLETCMMRLYRLGQGNHLVFVLFPPPPIFFSPNSFLSPYICLYEIYIQSEQGFCEIQHICQVSIKASRPVVWQTGSGLLLEVLALLVWCPTALWQNVNQTDNEWRSRDAASCASICCSWVLHHLENQLSGSASRRFFREQNWICAYHPNCIASLIPWEHFFPFILLFLFVVGVCACVLSPSRHQRFVFL